MDYVLDVAEDELADRLDQRFKFIKPSFEQGGTLMVASVLISRSQI